MTRSSLAAGEAPPGAIASIVVPVMMPPMAVPVMPVMPIGMVPMMPVMPMIPIDRLNAGILLRGAIAEGADGCGCQG
jgi:hypothetical protein